MSHMTKQVTNAIVNEINNNANNYAINKTHFGAKEIMNSTRNYSAESVEKGFMIRHQKDNGRSTCSLTFPVEMKFTFWQRHKIRRTITKWKTAQAIKHIMPRVAGK